MRRIELYGILRALQRLVESPPRSDQRSPFNFDHAPLSPSFDHVPIDAGRVKESAKHTSVERESIRRNQGNARNGTASQRIIEKGVVLR
jgi:hypothetical protein